MNSHTYSLEPPVETAGLILRWASIYDSFVNILTLGQSNRLRKMTVDHALLKPGEAVLDVGCGTGAVTIPAKKRVGPEGKASGIDPSPEMIAVASRKARKVGLEIDFRLGVIESLPYPDDSFDAVTSSLMMHHLPEDLQVKGLTEIFRVLKAGGRVLIVDTMQPTGFLARRLFASIASHHGVKFGIEALPEKLKSIGFSSAARLDDRMFSIGFVRATKPPAKSHVSE